jgi:hypothetical protein
MRARSFFVFFFGNRSPALLENMPGNWPASTLRFFWGSVASFQVCPSSTEHLNAIYAAGGSTYGQRPPRSSVILRSL